MTNEQKKVIMQQLADALFSGVQYTGIYDPEKHNPEFGKTPEGLKDMKFAWVLKKEPHEILMEMYDILHTNKTNT